MGFFFRLPSRFAAGSGPLGSCATQHPVRSFSKSRRVHPINLAHQSTVRQAGLRVRMRTWASRGARDSFSLSTSSYPRSNAPPCTRPLRQRLHKILPLQVSKRDVACLVLAGADRERHPVRHQARQVEPEVPVRDVVVDLERRVRLPRVVRRPADEVQPAAEEDQQEGHEREVALGGHRRAVGRRLLRADKVHRPREVRDAGGLALRAARTRGRQRSPTEPRTRRRCGGAPAAAARTRARPARGCWRRSGRRSRSAAGRRTRGCRPSAPRPR